MQSLMHARAGLAIAFCSLGLANHDAMAKTQADANHRAETYVAGLDKRGEPGCALGVLDLEAGNWRFQGAYGLADIETGKRITPEMRFGVASVTKQFTAAAAAIAAHQGHLSLDDDIRKHLPEMPEYGAPILVRDLVHHTNGLRDIGRLIDLTGKRPTYASRASRVKLLARQRALNFPPGTQYRYGNAGYMLLSEIIERATGRRFTEYVHDTIFRPLGMKDSYFGMHTRGPMGRARAYNAIEGRWELDESSLTQPGDWGQGGIVTTLEDYGKWARNLTAPESKLAGGRTLTRLLSTSGKLRDGSAVSYGFGLALEPYRNLQSIRHGGSGGGYKAYAMIFPQQKVGVFGLCNHGRYAQPVVMGLADTVLAPSQTDATDTAVPSIQLSRTQLERFAGTYREPLLRLPMIVEARERNLLVNGYWLPYAFEPVSERLFRNEMNAHIEFGGEMRGGALYLEQKAERFGTGRFERIEVTSHTPQQLASYIGDYYSEELDATYRFEVKEGSLSGQIVNDWPGGISPISLQPMLWDEFVSLSDVMALKFKRNNEGVVNGLVLTHQMGWITDVQFSRVDR